jgi:hypothetical protein
MSTLNCKNIQYPSGTGDIAIPSGTNLVSTVAGTFRAPGAVLQVVSSTQNIANLTTSSTTFTSTGLTASITPRATSSKILVMAQLTSVGNNSTSNGVSFAVYRNGSSVYSPGADNGSGGRYMYYATAAANSYVTVPLNYLDSPASVSNQTYTIFWSAFSASGVVYLGGALTSFAEHTITLMEIGG